MSRVIGTLLAASLFVAMVAPASAQTMMHRPYATFTFADASEAGNSPLAQSLFANEGVLGVFLGSDFITISKAPNKEWDVMKPLILGANSGNWEAMAALAKKAGAALASTMANSRPTNGLRRAVINILYILQVVEHIQ